MNPLPDRSRFRTIAMESSERLWFKRTCVVCGVSCLFMFVCCVYCTVLLQQMTELYKGCADKRISGDTGVVSATKTGVQEFFQDDPSLELDYMSRRRIIRSTRERRASKDATKTTTKTKKKSKKKKKGKKKIKAAHYQSMVTEPYIDAVFPSYSDGNLTNTQNAIRAFSPASWVNEKTSPFTLKDNGFFRARYTGIYLIYAQVLFYDNKEAQIVRLVQLRGDKNGGSELQALTCHESVNKSGPVRYHSCGITGLFSLKLGDVIYLQNVFSDVKLNLRLSTTFIGALLLK